MDTTKNMKKNKLWLGFGLVLLFSLFPRASTAGVYSLGLTDYQGNGVTSNTATGTRNALDIETIVSGSIIDPRVIRALTSASDSIAATQSGTWSAGRTWTLSSGTDSIAAVQSGTWTVQQGTPPWSVSQSGTWNITNITGTVSLPTGASTEATLAKLTQTQGSTTSGQSGPLVQGAVTTAAPTYSNAQTSPLSLTTAGALRTDASASTQPVSGTVTANAGTNLNTSALATSANLTAGTAKVQQVDGSGNVQPAGDVAARKIFVQPTDGTNNQAYTSTGEARVSTLDKNATGALTALNQAVTVSTVGMTVAVVQLLGTFNATAAFEASIDGGTTYFSISGIYLNVNQIPINQLNSTGQTSFYVAGFTNFRARVSVFTSGTMNVVVNTASGTLTDLATQIVREADNLGQLITSTAFSAKQRLDSDSVITDGTNTATVKAASTSPVIGDTAIAVSERPDNVGTVTQTSVSCAATSTTLLAAATATQFIDIRNPSSATVTIWINVTNTAAVAAAPSLDIPPGSDAFFAAEGMSWLPSTQINCISSGAASSVTLVYK